MSHVIVQRRLNPTTRFVSAEKLHVLMTLTCLLTQLPNYSKIHLILGADCETVGKVAFKVKVETVSKMSQSICEEKKTENAMESQMLMRGAGRKTTMNREKNCQACDG